MNRGTIFAACLAGALFATGMARSEETVLSLRPVTSLQATRVKDGTTLMRGTVLNATPHAGFRLRLRCAGDGRVRGEACPLQGERNTTHRIQVAVMADDAQRMPDGTVFINTAEPSASFRIVAAGDQEVPADSWRVMVTTSPR